jgi:hypothetical protein
VIFVLLVEQYYVYAVLFSLSSVRVHDSIKIKQKSVY